MKGRTVIVIILMLMVSTIVTVSADVDSQNVQSITEEKIKNQVDLENEEIIPIDPYQHPQPLGGGYYEITPPWRDGWVQKSHGSCVAEINLDTGEGRAYAYPVIGSETWAKCCITSSFYQWKGQDTSEAYVVFKAPSDISGDMINTDGAYASVTLACAEYDSNFQFVREWIEEVYHCTKTGNFYGDLDNVGIEIDLRKDYIYRVTAWAYAWAGLYEAGCDIDPVRFKKIWFVWEDEPNCEIEITKPLRGKLYYRGIFEWPRGNLRFGWPFALVTHSEISVTAQVEGTGCAYVKFSCEGDSCIDSSSSGGEYSGTLSPEKSNWYDVKATAYSSNDEPIDSHQVKVIFLKRR